ncbi:MCE family protein [Nocardia sp. NPDC006630]|uniref:MCE family protein n=1 Tax=Nocardia sp. NPDC006630 TaxID=3157181 RepID=UPI0033BAF583
MRSILGSAWRLAAFATVMLVVLGMVVIAIRQPVSGSTDGYRAIFTDANGLHTGDDVRMYGVRVGKVESIALEHDQAVVRLTVRRSSAIYDNSRLAIRYQNLTGQRYLDIQRDTAPAARTAPGATLGVDRTIPSFDVTSLFNGLKPVLATLSPEAINTFSESMLAVIEGDGNGVGPALDAIGRLSQYVGNRQLVISTLIQNMSEISDKIGGRSPQLVTLLGKLADVFQTLQTKIDGLIDFALTAPPVLEPIDDLLATLGLSENTNPDLDHIIRTLFPNPQEVIDILGQTPALLAALNAAVPAPGGPAAVCGHGAAELPSALKVLVSGQRVTVCNR